MFPDGILYASKESHYSVFKAARMYRMECVKVNTFVTGEIDCSDFKAKLFCNKDKPAIINVNIGDVCHASAACTYQWMFIRVSRLFSNPNFRNYCQRGCGRPGSRHRDPPRMWVFTRQILHTL